MIDILLSDRITLNSDNKIYAEHKLLANDSETKYFIKSDFNAKHWSTLEQKVTFLTYELRTALYDDFNTFNLTTKNDRYWDIIALHWINRIVRILFYKRSLISELNEAYPNALFHIENTELSVLNMHLSSEIFQKCEMQSWNSAVFKFILDEMGLKYKEHTVDLRRNDKVKPSKLKTRVYHTLKLILNRLNYFNRSYILSSYLPRKYELLLNFLNFQFPTFALDYNGKFEGVEPNIKRRTILIGQSINLNCEFNRIFRKILPHLVPSLFLENYNVTRDYVINQTYPKKPKFIFTSNAYDSDDYFKIYAAEKVENGTKYYIGQHGNFFHTPLLEASFAIPELGFSDKYLTWGNVVPAHRNMVTVFPFKLLGKKTTHYKGNAPIKDIVIIMEPKKLNRYTWDVAREYNLYLQRLRELHDRTLDLNMNFTLRAHNTFWNDEILVKWVKKNLYNFSIEPPTRTKSFDYHQNVLLLFTYDSTGISEALALGKRVIAFWEPDHHVVYSELQDTYDKMYENNIIFKNPIEVVEYLIKLNHNLHNLDYSQIKCVRDFLLFNGSTVNMDLTRLSNILNGKLG